MNFVHKNDGPRAVLAGLFRVGHYLLDLFDSREHCRKLDEFSLRDVGDDLRQGRLAHSRRSPEDDGTGIIALNLHAQRLARRKNVLLSDKFIQGSRTHAISQRATTFASLLIRECLEKAHALAL